VGRTHAKGRKIPDKTIVRAWQGCLCVQFGDTAFARSGALGHRAAQAASKERKEFTP
jgi:hypothetical protein